MLKAWWDKYLTNESREEIKHVVQIDENGLPIFDNEIAATARELLNFTPVNGKPIRIMYSHRDPSTRKSGFANVFIKNLDTSIDNKALHDTFAAFGTVLSCKAALDTNGQSKGYGFVQFDQDEAAQNAIKRLNGMLINDKQVYVGLFVRNQERNRGNGSPKFTNVYVKNLSETTNDEDLKIIFGNINDEKLKEVFSEFGNITSCKVMLDAQGANKGFGFVAFSNPEEATRALNAMNDKMIGQKPLYVAVAQRKEERRVHLQAHFAQLRSSGGIAPLPTEMPEFHPGGPRLAPQQLYIGQGTPSMLPPQPAGFGFQQQLLPSMYSGVAPNFIMPIQVQRQAQTGHRVGSRRGGNPHQMQQHQMLGEQLYPLVERLERDHAGKVTGMLLEMDQTEVLHLIESPDSLKKRVSEALDVLRASSGSDVSDHLGSLAIND
ncbi:hypothetical protein RHSIM_Rhsim06G0093100 [Rhododendron simsii]|uniref:PABP n=1 Tax=Rhododendron simsii TaxID=118357 RepID=A0A834LM58_RHOSS|nr:hypothetical protein RHSIM_Rhsim06G0093100 [Rhododendron simsii]